MDEAAWGGGNGAAAARELTLWMRPQGGGGSGNGGRHRGRGRGTAAEEVVFLDEATRTAAGHVAADAVAAGEGRCGRGVRAILRSGRRRASAAEVLVGRLTLGNLLASSRDAADKRGGRMSRWWAGKRSGAGTWSEPGFGHEQKPWTGAGCRCGRGRAAADEATGHLRGCRCGRGHG